MNIFFGVKLRDGSWESYMLYAPIGKHNENKYLSPTEKPMDKKKSILLVMGYGESLSGNFFFVGSSMLKFHPTGLHKSKTRWVNTSDNPNPKICSIFPTSS